MAVLMPGQDFYLPFRLLGGRIEARVSGRPKAIAKRREVLLRRVGGARRRAAQL